MAFGQINNGDSGLISRTLINAALAFLTIYEAEINDLPNKLRNSNNLSDVSDAVKSRVNILPRINGNSLKVLRVNDLETDYELAEINESGLVFPIFCATYNPVAGQTKKIGNAPIPPDQFNLISINPRTAGTIVECSIRGFFLNFVTPSAEPWSIYIEKNGSEEFLIQTIEPVSGGVERWSNLELEIPIDGVNDEIRIKIVHPNWVTTPENLLFTGYFKMI